MGLVIVILECTVSGILVVQIPVNTHDFDILLCREKPKEHVRCLVLQALE